MSKKLISGVYLYIGPLKNAKKVGFIKKSSAYFKHFRTNHSKEREGDLSRLFPSSSPLLCPKQLENPLFKSNVRATLSIASRSKHNLALFTLIFDQYELWNPLTSVKLSKKLISKVYIYVGPLKNPKKVGFIKESGCHCNRFFVTVTACLLVLMNRGLQKLSL